MAPPIAKVLAALSGERYADNSKALGALGDVFTQSADINPNYFVVPGRVPESDLTRLAAKHGISMEHMGGMGVRAITDDGSTGYMTMQTTPFGILKRLQENPSPMEYRNIMTALKRGELNPHTDMYGIDMMAADSGTGAAKQMYPALYEWLLAQPDAANATFSGLSVNNMTRRSQHMTGALEKFGDKAGNRLRIDDDQIVGVGESPRAPEYHKLATPEKVGLLNALGANQTAGKVNAMLRDLSRRHHQGDRNVTETGLSDEARSLGVLNNAWEPSTDVGADYLPRLFQLLMDANGKPSVGVDSLRRAAITYDAAGRGLTAKDLAAQTYLTNRLARKSGGSIPGNTPGALTQTCGCAGSKS